MLMMGHTGPVDRLGTSHFTCYFLDADLAKAEGDSQPQATDLKSLTRSSAGQSQFNYWIKVVSKLWL
jgi:hypothetical protein